MVTQKDVSFLPKQSAKVTKQRVVLTCVNIVIFTFNMVKVTLKFFSHNIFSLLLKLKWSLLLFQLVVIIIYEVG